MDIDSLPRGTKRASPDSDGDSRHRRDREADPETTVAGREYKSRRISDSTDDNKRDREVKKSSKKHKSEKKDKKSRKEKKEKNEKKEKKDKRKKEKKKRSKRSSSSSSSSGSDTDGSSSSGDSNAPRSIITGKKIKMSRDITLQDRIYEIERAAKRHSMNSQF